jgi:hypothetical protein
MDLAKANEVLQKLDLPDWVRAREAVLEYDQDDDPYIRVWLDVDDDFDFDGHVDEVGDAIWRAEESIYNLGRELFVFATLRSPIFE